MIPNGEWLDDAAFYSRLARHAGLRFVVLDDDAIGDPDYTEINPLASRLLTEELCRHFHLLPIAYRDGVVAVALCDPFDQLATELVTALTASTVQPVLASPDDVDRAITRIFGPLRAPNFDELGPPPGRHATRRRPARRQRQAVHEQVDAALHEQHRTGSRIGEVLLHAGLIGEDELVAALAEQFEMPVLDIEDGQVDADVVRLIPEPLARELRVAAVAEDELTLYVAVCDALGADAIEQLERYTEANSDLKNWIRQRSRWIKGYIQTYLVHMRNPIKLMRQSGFKGFVSFQLLVGGTFIFLLNPIFWALTTIFFITQAGFIQALFPTFVFYLAASMLLVGNFVFLYLNVAGSIQRGLSAWRSTRC